MARPKNMNSCAIVGCGKPARRRGWCEMHYGRWYQHGDPLITKRAPDGAGYTRAGGYRVIHSDGELRYEHVVIAERALGRRLPKSAIVHHADENRANNVGSNLVICPSRAYHNLIHQRMRALAACGNASFRKCAVCKKHDDPARMYVNGKNATHRECANQRRKTQCPLIIS